MCSVLVVWVGSPPLPLCNIGFSGECQQQQQQQQQQQTPQFNNRLTKFRLKMIAPMDQHSKKVFSDCASQMYSYKGLFLRRGLFLLLIFDDIKNASRGTPVFVIHQALKTNGTVQCTSVKLFSLHNFLL